MAKTEAYRAAQARYDAKNTRGYGLKLNVVTDADIIAKLDSVPNKQEYMKAVIRADIQKG